MKKFLFGTLVGTIVGVCLTCNEVANDKSYYKWVKKNFKNKEN